jgi:hypothetical protein
MHRRVSVDRDELHESLPSPRAGRTATWQAAIAACMMMHVATEGPKIKVCLVNEGDDVETPWAIDLGPADGAPNGSRRVRLINVPFLHAKPTWGDVIVVTPADGRHLTWNGDGVAYSEIGTLIEEDGGRFAVIIGYTPHAGTTDNDAFKALADVFERDVADLSDADAVCEHAIAPNGERPGRAYLAVKYDLLPATVMERLHAANLPCDVTLIHPIDDPEEPDGSD